MNAGFRAWADLLRLKYFAVWPLLFCSCCLLATTAGSIFPWQGAVLALAIGFLGFEAGLVLNDYTDREYDARDVDKGRLARFWRPFGTKPIPEGQVSRLLAASLAAGLAILMAGLILLLPYPHAVFVLLLMILFLALGIFYQEEQRQQKHPFAQLIGGIGFALFPVAGYLCAGLPDKLAFLLFIFFYPFGLAFLGATDIVDLGNDRARGMQTVPVIFSSGGAAYWVAGFSAVHCVAAVFLLLQLGWVARAGILAGLALVLYADSVIFRHRADPAAPDAVLRVLPCFPAALVLYAAGFWLSAIL